MPYNVLLRDLAVVMIVAGMVTLLFHRLRQPVILGYILAGLIIGPHTPPYLSVVNQESIHTLADLGVIFLMFSLGLQFNLRSLKQVGATAFIASTLEILLMLWLGYRIGMLFGWSKMDSLFLGAMLSITSTTMIVKTLTDLGLLKAPFAQSVFAIQIVEDTLGMTMVALLSSMAISGSLEATAAILPFGRVVIFVSATLVFGLILVPRFLRYVARFRNNEMLLISVLGLCFGLTLLSMKLGFSLALGAFLMGTIVGEAREIGKIKLLTEPVRDMFSAVFFVTIGMLLDPSLLIKNTVPILVITLAVIVGKVGSFSFGAFVSGNDLRTSLRVGTSMIPIGELSFIIAAMGLTLNVTSDFLYPVAIGVAAITMPIAPYLAKHADPLIDRFERLVPAWFLDYVELYRRRLGRSRVGSEQAHVRRIVRRQAWHIALNVTLLTGVFMAAAWVAEPAERWWTRAPAMLGGAKGLVWLCAALAGLPLLIALVRQFRALSMILTDINVSEMADGKGKTAVSALLSNTILFTALLGLGLWLLLISSALLPPLSGLVVMLVILVLVAVLFTRFFIQIHSRAQFALAETLAQPSPAEAPPPAPPLPAMLRASQLETVTLPAGSSATGKLISELKLRTRTGATIVAIERAGDSIVNPGPDEELQTDDKILLLGQSSHLTAAREILTTTDTP